MAMIRLNIVQCSPNKLTLGLKARAMRAAADNFTERHNDVGNTMTIVQCYNATTHLVITSTNNIIKTLTNENEHQVV